MLDVYGAPRIPILALPIGIGRCLDPFLKFQLRTLNSLPPQTKGKH
jgi:hypothetical protein